MLPRVKTPGHLVVNTTLLHRWAQEPQTAAGVVVGAVLPDLPIMVLYAWHKLVRRVADDEEIWRGPYQRPWFLALVHGLHSFPIGAAVALAGWAAGVPALLWAGVSLLLHAAADWPIHGEDAHRHFLPFSQARFISPLSYWDVRRHARVVAAVECALVVACAAALYVAAAPSPLVVACAAIAVGYPIHYALVFARRAPA